MQEKKTLFYFLYDSLKQQILSGCRQYGSPLPSLRIPRKKIPLCVSFCSGNPLLSRFMKQWSC